MSMTEAEELELLELEDEEAKAKAKNTFGNNPLVKGAKAVGGLALRGLDWVSHLGQPKAAKEIVNRIQTENPPDPNAPPQMYGTGPGGFGMATPSQMDVRPNAAAAVDMATSPSTYVAPLASQFAKVPWLARVMANAPKAMEATSAGLESGLTGKTTGTLRAASTSQGAKAIKEAAGTEPDIARKLLGIADKPGDYTAADLNAVRSAEEGAGMVDLRDVLKSFDEAKIPPRGAMGANTDIELRVNKRIANEKKALMGDLPSEKEIAEMDFGGNLEDAREALSDPESKWGALKSIAENAAKQAQKAQGILNRSTSKAAKEAGKYGNAPKTVQNYEGFPQLGYQQNPELPGLLQSSKSAQQKASEAYIDAQGKMAAGEITAQDAARAKAELDHSTKNLQIADAANEFSKGEPLDKIASGIAERHKISGVDLQDVLTRGRDKVANNSFTPNYEISVEDLRKLKTSIGKSAKFDDPEAKAFESAMQKVYGSIRENIVSKVAESKGLPAAVQYEKDLETLSNKINDFKELNSKLGKTNSGRLDKAVAMIKSSAKTDRPGIAELLQKIDKYTGNDIHSKAEYARMAREFTEFSKEGEALNPAKAGVPSWKPAGGGVAIGETALGAIMHSSGLPPWAIASIEAPLITASSPAMATKAIIPFARNIPKIAGKIVRNSPALSAVGAADASQTNLPPWVR